MSPKKDYKNKSRANTTNKGQVYGSGISGQNTFGRRISVQGNYNENINGDYIQGNYYAIAEFAAEIQKLLQQLEQTYPTDTTTGKMTIATKVIEHIDNDPYFSKRIHKTLQRSNISLLEKLLNHPATGFVLAALEDWQMNQKNNI